jgi:acyl-CoA thioester hydrolase
MTDRLNQEPAATLSACVDIHIPLHDADPAGFVWHGRYFKYFEEARRQLMESLDYGHLAMASSGFVWPVVDTRVKFLRPLRFDQRARVRADLREWEMRLVVDYTVTDKDGAITTRAHTIQVPVSLDTGEMQLGSPAILLECVGNALEKAHGGQ